MAFDTAAIHAGKGRCQVPKCGRLTKLQPVVRSGLGGTPSPEAASRSSGNRVRRLQTIFQRDAAHAAKLRGSRCWPVITLAYIATIDDPGRFGTSKALGAYLGLTPRI